MYQKANFSPPDKFMEDTNYVIQRPVMVANMVIFTLHQLVVFFLPFFTKDIWKQSNKQTYDISGVN